MSINELELSDGTLRQRRNLFVISILLILIHHADITLGESIKFQGLSLHIGKPYVITMFLQLSLGYFLWRFYQYFNRDKAYSHLKQQYRDSRKQYLNLAVRDSVLKREEIRTLRGAFEYEDLKKKDKKEYVFNAESNCDDPHEFKPISVKIPAKEIEPARIKNAFSFAFRGKILTDFYVPYILALYATYLQFV